VLKQAPNAKERMPKANNDAQKSKLNEMSENQTDESGSMAATSGNPHSDSTIFAFLDILTTR
jgi:hypothetical protein